MIKKVYIFRSIEKVYDTYMWFYLQSVNSRGVIGSVDETQEECIACLKGSCNSINGIYTRHDLPPGYSLVTQIPAGACRILIQQLKHSRNFLGEFPYNFVIQNGII